MASQSQWPQYLHQALVRAMLRIVSADERDTLGVCPDVAVVDFLDG